MSANHRPVRKQRRPATRPAPQAALTTPLLTPVSEPEPSATTVVAPVAEQVAATRAVVAAAASASEPDSLVAGHLTRISGLLQRAEQVAEALLDSVLRKVQRGEQVYPGELVHICRGLHVLAKCSAELARGNRKPAGGLTTAQVEQLEARLRTALGV